MVKVDTIDEAKVREMVRQVVLRTVGAAQLSPSSKQGRLVAEQDLQRVPVGGEYVVSQGALVTPLARQTALERNISLVEGGATPEHREAPAGSKTVAVGADHGGFEFKESLKRHLRESGYTVIDCGTNSRSAVDYPDFAFAVAQLVAQGQAWRGILVDGAGIGSCMAANKVPGVRAAMCYDDATAVNSRAHNDANVLTLGAGLIGADLGRRIVTTWLETPAGGDRHARRVGKIMDIERRFLRHDG